MQSVTLRSHVGADGMLNLQIPVALKDIDVEVVLTMRPVDKGELENLAQANGWPPGFFEATFGCLPELPEREAQGEYETREEF